MIFRKIVTTLLALVIACCTFAQDTAQTTPSQTSGLRADGKIYVVVAVVVVILLGLFAYLVRLDLKISKLEKQQ